MKKQNTFLRLSFQYGFLLIGFMIFSFLLSRIFAEGSELISGAINNMIDGAQINIRRMFGVTAWFVVLSMIFAFLKKICGETYSILIQKESKNLVAKCIGNMEYGYIGKEAGAFITKLTSDVDKIGELFSEIIPEVLQSLITICVLGISIFMLDRKLLVSVFVCFPAVLYIGNRLAISVNRLAKTRREKYDVLTQTARDNIAGIAVARSFHLFDVLNKRVEEITDDILQNEIARNRYQAIGTVIQSLTRWFPTIICSFIALMEVINEKLAIGEFMAFIMLFQKISTPLSELPFRINDGREILVSVRRINDIYQAPMEIGGDYCADRVEADAENIVIRLGNASFRYESNAEREILQDINLEIESGKMTAIVGKSSCGKTTLLKILCGFEKLNSGAYYLGSHEFQDWNLTSARKKIALVSQNIFLFPDTIMNNIAYGMEAVSGKEVIQACRAAHIHEYIISLPNGYDTVVEENGANFSGGQRQRIALARAFLKKADILLLDEPTSALDAKTEEAVGKALFDHSSDKTIIVIAHRLSTIKEADKIVVLENGKIAEAGTHTELLLKKGAYAKLCEIEKQAQAEQQIQKEEQIEIERQMEKEERAEMEQQQQAERKTKAKNRYGIENGEVNHA